MDPKLIQIIDLSRGRDSLAMIESGLISDYIVEGARVMFWQLLSGYGDSIQPDDWEDLLGFRPLVLWPGWICDGCGAEGREAGIRECPECGHEARILPTRWNDKIKEYKIKRHRLAYTSTPNGF